METHRNENLTVGTSPVVVSIEKANVNGRRVGIILMNNSTGGQHISLGIDTEAVDGKGIHLIPSGSWADTMDGNYYPTQKQITAVSDLAGAVLVIYERIGGM